MSGSSKPHQTLCCVILCILSMDVFAVEGTVKWFNADKGFGFITPDDGGPDVFVHFSELVDTDSLKEGQRIKFDVNQGPKGPQAANVVSLESSSLNSTTKAKVGNTKPSADINKKVSKKPFLEGKIANRKKINRPASDVVRGHLKKKLQTN